MGLAWCLFAELYLREGEKHFLIVRAAHKWKEWAESLPLVKVYKHQEPHLFGWLKRSFLPWREGVVGGGWNRGVLS